MAKITVLDDNTINQIAAGEVVERPVSVVKELVENAIDAGATSISVEIKEGGISLIRITDNGSGIEKNSIRTAFLRHATSKISSIDDLNSVRSLGFRGEALASIAAVAQIELLTKVKSEMFGIRYCLNGGREMSFDEAGVPDGTTIIVRNLFYNTPARKKFLKSAMTEGNYISDLMEKLILSHPEISFRFISNGKDKLLSVGNNNIIQDIYAIYGKDISSNIIGVNYECEEFSVTGYIGKPEISRGNRNFEIIYVNGRYVKNNVISKAVEEAYKSYLMQHKYPFVLLYFDIPTTEIDVNVHPAKTEIRLLKEQQIYNNLINVVIDYLSSKELIPSVTNDIIVKEKDSTISSNSNIFLEQDLFPDRHSNESDCFKHNTDIEVRNPGFNNLSNTVYKEKCNSISIPEPFETEKISKLKAEASKTFEDNTIIVEGQSNLFETGFLKKENVIRHKIIGQVFDTYWIIEFDEKMYIIDQHAAHEKVLYERIRNQIDNGEVFSQNLSPAIIVSLSNTEIDMLGKYMDNFEALGFKIEHFGGKEYTISAVPTELFRLEAKDYFMEVLDELKETHRISDTQAVNDRIATMACKAAVKGNMKLSYAEATALIDELLTLENPFNCPHGRPTIVAYSKQELEKMFKRIV